MTSFGYRLNPRYAIKECSSCGTLYTRDCCCSKGNVADKILVPKPPKNYARPGYTFPRLPKYSRVINDSTNVVNAPREPFVVKQDHGSFVDKIIWDLNKAPDSPHLHTFLSNQRYCFHCKDVLGDGESCPRCTCTRCGSGLSKGLCYICGNNQNSLYDSPSISKNSSQSPPHINHHCCYECGDALDGIFYQRCTYLFSFDEFAGELTLLKSIPSRIDETDCHLEEEPHFTKRLLYDNSSPLPPEEFVSENSNADIKSFSPSPIPIKDSDSHMKENDFSFNPNDPMPPDIEEDDDDSERDIPILEELLDNYSLSLLKIESFHFDIPSSYRPPAKPPDGNAGILNIKMIGNISDQKVPIPNLMITRVSSQGKSPDLLPYQGLEAFQSFAECPMMINEKNTPILDVPLFNFYPLDQLKYGGN
nr:hypothetical protein [Tanacetum cinerariifolium]